MPQPYRESKADYMRVQRAKARAEGKRQLLVTLPADLLERIDAEKADKNLRARDELVAEILRGHFEAQAKKGTRP